MPQWVSIFDRTPIHHTTYYVKINGKKRLLLLAEFQKHLYDCETFLWLDESDEEKSRIQSLINIKSIDEFAQLDRQLISEQLLTPYNPYIQRSIVMRQFHKYYLRIIASLRKEISQQQPYMLNDEQEDEVRNLLTQVTIYFQIDQTAANGEFIKSQKEICKEAVKRLIIILGKDGNHPFKKINGNPIKKQDNKVSNLLLDKIKMINNNPFI